MRREGREAGTADIIPISQANDVGIRGKNERHAGKTDLGASSHQPARNCLPGRRLDIGIVGEHMC